AGMGGGAIGWGLPAAIGVKLGLPERPVLALIGDGSAMFNCQALWTAAHERLAVVFLILNNGAYRILKQRVNALPCPSDRPLCRPGSHPSLDRFRRAGALPGRGRRAGPDPRRGPRGARQGLRR